LSSVGAYHNINSLLNDIPVALERQTLQRRLRIDKVALEVLILHLRPRNLLHALLRQCNVPEYQLRPPVPQFADGDGQRLRDVVHNLRTVDVGHPWRGGVRGHALGPEAAWVARLFVRLADGSLLQRLPAILAPLWEEPLVCRHVVKDADFQGAGACSGGWLNAPEKDTSCGKDKVSSEILRRGVVRRGHGSAKCCTQDRQGGL